MAKKLTKKQKGFARDYLETGNGTIAALNNYDIEGKNPEKIASAIAVENLGKPSVKAYLESKAEKAAEFVYTLAESAENEGVRLGASKDILDRAGFKPVDKSMSVSVAVDAKPSENISELANALLLQQRLT